LTDKKALDEPETDARIQRQRLLAAVLEAFPTEQLHPYGEKSKRYQKLVESRADRSLAEVQGMFTARFSLTTRRWRRFLDDHLRRQGQSLLRWHCLFEVSVNDPGETLTSLAMRIGVMSAALVGLLDELEKDGLILRTVDESDRRSKLITLTPAGEEAVTFMYDLTAELREDFLRGIAESEMRIMLDAMDVMTKNLDRMNYLR
jgi:MarR family transcriptional regulator for hemolysin